MLRYAEALEKIRKEADVRGPLPVERVAAAACPGRIAAERVVATEALPAFDNSSMDGFAVRAVDTAKPPVRLRISGTVSAGDPHPSPRLLRGGGELSAVEIMTGAPMPPGFDAVVPIEKVRRVDGFIELSEPAEAGDYVRRAGSDVSPGAVLIEAGEKLDARHVLAMAALGIDAVWVRRRPKLALISTGRELADPGRAPAPGQIRNATTDYLSAAAEAFGFQLAYLGNAPDDEDAFLKLAGKALSDGCDALVTTGAVSMGKHDFVTETVGRLGAKPVFHKAAIRPGKPVLFASIEGGPVVFGLPGNPLSTVVGLRFFVEPYLRRRLGRPDELPFLAALAEETSKPDGLRCFFKARWGGVEARALEGQASFRIEPLLRANAWVVLPEEGETAPRGLPVDVYPLWP